MSGSPIPIEDRFWAKVDKRSDSECWEWQGYRALSGHGQIGKGRRGEGQILVHVYSYLLHGGCLPPHLFVLHHCDNGWCVNPGHLYAGTKGQNLQDAWDRKRRVSHNSLKSFCPYGHAYDVNNTYVSKSNRRHCKQCAHNRYLSRKVAA